MAREFSEIMSGLRKARGVSQRTAAAELRISQALLSHYENGAREPGLQFVRRACVYYGVSADYLLGLTDRPAPAEAPAEDLPSELRRMADMLEKALKEAKP